MNDKEFSKLLHSDEQPNIEYKSKWYDINSSDGVTKERQRGELIKDIVSLANGNVTSAGKIAYLIIGASNKPNDRGERELFDVGEMGDLDALGRTILDWLKGAVKPPIDDVRLELFAVSEKRVLLITIPPTPFLHETVRRLNVSGSSREFFDECSAIIRRGDKVEIATNDERKAIEERKKAALKESRKVSPIYYGVIVGAIANGSLVATASPRLMGQPDTLQLRLIGLLIGAALGGFMGWSVGQFSWMVLDLRISWYRYSTIIRLVLLILFVSIVLFGFYIILYSTQ